MCAERLRGVKKERLVSPRAPCLTWVSRHWDGRNRTRTEGQAVSMF